MVPQVAAVPSNSSRVMVVLVVPPRTHLADGSAVFTEPKREDADGVFAPDEVAEVVGEILVTVGHPSVESGEEEQS